MRKRDMYLACGNTMSDAIEENGVRGEHVMGGNAAFSLIGMRLFTKNVRMVTRVGEDYKDTYGRWMDDNGISHEGMFAEMEQTTKTYIKHNPDGTYDWSVVGGMEDWGYLTPHPEDLDQQAGKDSVKGVYTLFEADRKKAERYHEVKQKHGFKLMWELLLQEEYHKADKQLVKQLSEFFEMFSINEAEAARLFDIPRGKDEDIINELMKFPVECTLYRVGKRGAYAVTPTDAVFCESIDIPKTVDPTGCGNCSTGAALWAHLEWGDPAMTVAAANVAAGFLAAHKGFVPLITDDIMKQAGSLTRQYGEKLKKR